MPSNRAEIYTASARPSAARRTAPQCSMPCPHIFIASMLLLSLLSMGGCRVCTSKLEYYPDMSHQVSDWGQNGKTISLVPGKGKTVFRFTFSEGYLFTFSMWNFEWLEFVMPTEQTVPGRVFQFADLSAWSGGFAYIQGAGRLTKGSVKVESVGKNAIELLIDSPEIKEVHFNKDFQGRHLFMANLSPSPKELKGFIVEPQTSESTANRQTTTTATSPAK